MRPLAAVLAVAVAAVAAPVPKELKEKRPDYCPMVLGDKREYVHPSAPDVVTQTREITAVEEKDGWRYCTQRISTGQVTVMRTNATGVYVVSSGGTVYETPYKAVGPTIKEGDKWECNDANGMTRTVGKAEKVETPAGTFTAFPVVIEYAKFPGSGKQTLWYADGVGMVRYDSGDTTTLVLKAFTPGKDKERK